jgi:hypothetical protein
MGVDYLYCGECRQCYNDNYFDRCDICDELETADCCGYKCYRCAEWYYFDKRKTKKYCDSCFDDEKKERILKRKEDKLKRDAEKEKQV